LAGQINLSSAFKKYKIIIFREIGPHKKPGTALNTIHICTDHIAVKGGSNTNRKWKP